MEHIIGIGASLRQNGKPLLITRTKLKHQRRQILTARNRSAYGYNFKPNPIKGGKGLESQLDRN